MSSALRQQSLTAFSSSADLRKNSFSERSEGTTMRSGCGVNRKFSVTSVNSAQEPNQAESEFPFGTELTVMYFACKCETFQLKKNYKRFQRILKSRLSCGIIGLENDLGDGLLAFCNLVILAGLNAPLTQTELGLLLEYVENGGSVLVLAESTNSPQLYNAFTRHFGITVVKDSVISVIRQKQYHPKECLISNAIICPTILPASTETEKEDENNNVSILYPHGCSLDVSNAAATIMSTSVSTYPCNRPIGAIYYNQESKGRVVVYGSGHSFSDQYIQVEDNKKLLEILLDVLMSEELPELIVRDLDLKENDDIHCTASKAERYRGVLQDIDEYIFPATTNHIGSLKPMSLVTSKLGENDYSFLTEVFRTYEQLQLDRVPLSQTVTPQFEVSMPPLKLAVFPPTFRPLPPPPLELYDLDEEFSSVETRLGRLVNKCAEHDLEFCLDSIGKIFDINVKAEEENKGKAILHSILMELVEFKLASESVPSSSPSSLSMIEDKYFVDPEENSDDEKKPGQ